MTKHQAYLDGWLAHMKDTAKVEENPYNELTQAFSHQQWYNGWCARFSAIKHNSALTYDDCEFSNV